MHIVLVNREYPPSQRLGGIGSYNFEFSKALVNNGHKVTVVCASDNTKISINEKNEYGVRIIRLAKGDFCIDGSEKCLKYLKYLRLFTRYYLYRKSIINVLKNIEDIDIIEFADFGDEAHFMLKINYPWVVRLHGPMLFDRNTLKRKKLKISLKSFYDYFSGLFEYKTISNATGITSCSQYLKNWIEKDLRKPLKIETIYNFINTDKWLNDTNKVLTYKKTKIFKIFYAGTIVREKGVFELINACKMLKERGLDLQLTLAGKLGTVGEKLKSETKKLDYINFLGHTSQSILKNYYENSDLSCFPSYWESFGLVTIEAMATGALVLGSSTGGMAEIIDDEIDGFLCTPKDENILSKKIEYIHNLSENDIIRIKINAISKVKEKFTEKVVINKFINYYERIIKEYKK